MQHNFELEKRRFVIGGLVLLIFLIYILRLFNLQIVDDKYQAMAHNNAFLTKTIYPARGQIYDRNGNLLVYNQPAYDLVVTMREVKDLDTLDLCNTLGITREAYEKIVQRIAEFRKDIIAIATSETATEEVYRLNVQFFPMTKKSVKKD